MPKSIQEELLEYPETIENDSSYEDDAEVLKKYKDKALDYVISKDVRKKEDIQHQQEPRRI